MSAEEKRKERSKKMKEKLAAKKEAAANQKANRGVKLPPIEKTKVSPLQIDDDPLDKT